MNTQGLLDLFEDFVEQAQLAICGTTEPPTDVMNFASVRDKAGVQALGSVSELLRDQWNVQSRFWPTIESRTAYVTTMRTLLERLSSRCYSPRPLRILSLGSGPGIYETFLAYYFSVERKMRITIRCVDYAKGMTDVHQSVLQSRRIRIGNTDISKLKQCVLPIHGDMTDLKEFAGKADIVIANNSLQWTDKWREVLEGTKLALDEHGQRLLFLFIHPYRMCLRAMPADGGEVSRGTIGDADPALIMLYLERNGFVLNDESRMINGLPGGGQAGHTFVRMFIEAERGTPV